MKILVLGSQGMAGHTIVKYLRNQGHRVFTAAKQDASSEVDFFIDVESQHSVESFSNILFFSVEKFDFVINCIGLLVAPSIERPDRASLINSWFPHYLEYKLKNTNTRLIHLSTDCVFNGKNGPYIETDDHTELNAYGRSKSLGEINNNKDITFRMSIIGPELKKNGTGLLNWILTSPDSELKGWKNAWWNGITTLQLAKCIEQYIQNPSVTGVYHVVSNENRINKFQLLTLINEIYCLDKTIVPIDGPKEVNKILIDTRKLIDFNIPLYAQMIAEMKNFDS